MRIERHGPYYTAVCDICGDRLPGEETFMDAVRSKKPAGWRSRKDKYGDWEDICPECQREERDNAGI